MKRYLLVKIENTVCHILNSVNDKQEAMRWKRRFGKYQTLMIWDLKDRRSIIV